MVVHAGRQTEVGEQSMIYLFESRGHIYVPVVKLGFLQNGNFQFLLTYGTFLQEFTLSDVLP